MKFKLDENFGTASGIVVIRVPRNPSLALLERLVRQFLQALNQMRIEKQLWIVEIGRNGRGDQWTRPNMICQNLKRDVMRS